jgi:hypothetical protein
MLQRRQIVKALGNQIDIEDPEYTKCAIKSFDYISQIFISVIVTTNRNAALLQKYENSHFIMTTKLLRSSI